MRRTSDHPSTPMQHHTNRSPWLASGLPYFNPSPFFSPTRRDKASCGLCGIGCIWPLSFHQRWTGLGFSSFQGRILAFSHVVGPPSSVGLEMCVCSANTDLQLRRLAEYRQKSRHYDCLGTIEAGSNRTPPVSLGRYVSLRHTASVYLRAAPTALHFSFLFFLSMNVRV
ncbi:hypothetical protein GE09DRAFT_265552 [Coniochaeta sp. 2T2.1]|nr:hypothetical protein GE09DRAFT_265552 [Coniochaeta sp. 2T2.1]